MLKSLLLAGVLANVAAAGDPYAITPEESAACKGDAERLCADTYPNEHRLLLCMKADRTQLSRQCLVIFDAGMKRRGL